MHKLFDHFIEIYLKNGCFTKQVIQPFLQADFSKKIQFYDSY